MGEPFSTDLFTDDKNDEFNIVDFVSFVWNMIHEENLFLPLVEHV